MFYILLCFFSYPVMNKGISLTSQNIQAFWGLGLNGPEYFFAVRFRLVWKSWKLLPHVLHSRTLTRMFLLRSNKLTNFLQKISQLIFKHELRNKDALVQRCPTLSPFATSGDRQFKCGDKLNSLNFKFLGNFKDCDLYVQ